MSSGLLLEAARQLSDNPSIIYSQMVNFSSDQWDQMEEYCRQRLNLPNNWKEINWHRTVEEAKRLGWGIKFGPTGKVNVRILKLDKDVKFKGSVDQTQQSLF